MALGVQYDGSGTMVTEDQKDRFPFPTSRNYPAVRFDCSAYDMAKIPLGQFAANEAYFLWISTLTSTGNRRNASNVFVGAGLNAMMTLWRCIPIG